MFALALALVIAMGALVGFGSASIVGAIVGAFAGAGVYVLVFGMYLIGDHAAELRWSRNNVEELDGDFVRFFAGLVLMIVAGAAIAWLSGMSDAHSLAVGFAAGGALWSVIVGALEIDNAMRRRYAKRGERSATVRNFDERI